MKNYRKNTNNGTIFDEKFNRTIRHLLTEAVFRKNAHWIYDLGEVFKKNNCIHSSRKLTLIQASEESDEIEIYNIIREKSRRKKTKVWVGDFESASILRITFTKDVLQSGVLIFIQKQY